MLKFFMIFFFFLVISLPVSISFGQGFDNNYKYPCLISTFYSISNANPKKFDENSLFLLFTKSLDSVFNFNQKISKNDSKIRIDLYDSVILFNYIKIDTIEREHHAGILSWGQKDIYNIVNPEGNAKCIERYCNIVQPKINFILSKYNINIGCDYFLSNFLISLTCPTCWVFSKSDYQKYMDGKYSCDLKFSKVSGTKCVIYKDVTISDSIKIRAGANIIKAENIPTQLLPYGLLEKLMIDRKDKTTKLLIEQDNKLIECKYTFRKDTTKEFAYKLINDSIAMLKLNSLYSLGLTDSIRKQLISDSFKIKKIIIDLRQCPGGLLEEVVRFSDLFLDENHFIGERYSEQTFWWNSNFQYVSMRDNVLRNTRIFILTDTMTASGAEIIVGALKTYKRAEIIGQGTEGAGMIRQTQSLFGISDYYITINTSDFITAKKYKLGVDRVLPDIYCMPKLGSDNVLELALKMCK